MCRVYKGTLFFLLFFVLWPIFPVGQEEEQPVLPGTSGQEWETLLKERQQERERMVKSQIRTRGVTDKQVLSAMETVPRHLFVPKKQQPYAYNDSPLPIGYGQTISQPFMVAYMTQVLGIKSGDKVLEIGTGSGYQAAVLSAITPRVYSMEIIRELGQRTARLLKEYHYQTIKLKIDDGYYGWEEEAPFDAIIVTAAAGHVPPPLISQLKPGGRIVIPVGGVYQIQTLMLITKSKEGSIRSLRLMPVRFVPMTGAVMGQNE